jgi:hypothetical protein
MTSRTCSLAHMGLDVIVDHDVTLIRTCNLRLQPKYSA